MSFSYRNELEGLRNRIDAYYEEYIKKVTEADDICQKHKENYDKIVNVINSERHDLRTEIRKLYKFLNNFGDVGIPITPFDYIAEDLGHVQYERFIGKGDSDFEGKKGSFATYFVFGLPGKAVEAFINRGKNKKMFEEKTIEFNELQSQWEKDVQHRKDVAAFLKDAESIADIYRILIATIKDAIDETILPELSAIRAFLYADAVKESILYGEDPSESEPKNIQLFKGSLYDIHYQFIRNTLDYYVMISRFFKEAVLTRIIEDKVVTQEEKNEFNNNISNIKSQLGKLKNTAILEG